MAVYGFSADDAKRIGKVVRQVERGPDRIRLSGASADGAAPGVRLLLGQYAGSSWPTSQTAIVTVYNGDTGSVVSAATVVAYNHFVKFSEQTNCTNRWVALGHNGFHWMPVEAGNACTATAGAQTCVIEVGGVDFSQLPGYQKTATQVLGHAGGCIKWFDTSTCSTAAA